ncbi:MAG: glycoside hydrolase family 3 C-terminal domain-containing protein [Oscillospiraceae bacterium]|nr:glycoside hydrolase family 3 C-terminal domain-containing protein [Oscillospiraceae bacterium]
MKKQYQRMMPFGSVAEQYDKPFRDDTKFRVARQMELESILLLRNENHALPLPEDKAVALLGNGHIVTNTGGGGSGGGLGAFCISFLTAMDNKSLPYVKALADYYRSKKAEGHGSFADVHGWEDSDETLWGAQQFSNSGWNNAAPIAVPELKLSEDLVEAAAKEARTALVFLSRTVGTEEMDRGIPRPSDWYLNPSEEQLISQALNRFDKVILVVSSSGSIDLSWLDRLDPEGRIQAIVYSYGAGSHYGDVLTDLIYGRANFSARLTDTMARTIEAHFTTRNFGGQQSYASNGTAPGFGDNGRRYNTLNGPGDPVSIYQEYVYMGYRYFDTFRGNSDDVVFPFGFGLSYSEFRFSGERLSRDGENLVVTADVTNLSQMPGKAVLEVYASSPNDGALDQPYQRLMGFAKSSELSRDQTEQLCVRIPLRLLASYSEEMAAYVLEPGLHLIRVGDSSRNTVVCGALDVKELVVVERLKNRLGLDMCNPDGDDANRKEFDALRLNSQKGCDPIGSREKDKAELASGTILPLRQADVAVFTPAPKAPYAAGTAPEGRTATLQAVAAGSVSLSDFAAQLTNDEAACLLAGGVGIGRILTCPDDPGISLTTQCSKPMGPNTRSTGAGSSRANGRVGIPSLTYCDGSGGIMLHAPVAERLNTDPNPGYPKAPGIAASWNPELYALWGKTVASEMHVANVDVWLAPSINMHRNPLNGRNAEYYSEDPVLSGIVASAVAKSVGEAGLTVCLKHFAGNDQEQYRRGRHTRHSEAAGDNLDAINTISAERALREINLKPFEMAIRTGQVHCVMSAFNKVNGSYCASCSDLLTGILRDEWGFDGFVVTDWGDYDEIANGADELIAGNDVIMSGTHTRYSISDQIFDGIRSGRLSRAMLLRNVQNLLTVILRSRNIFPDGQFNTGCINGSDVPYHEKTALRICTTVLPEAIVGVPYENLKLTPLAAAGDEGTTGFAWSIAPDSPVSEEALAALGLTLHGSGMLSGAPVSGSEGSYQLRFQVQSDYGKAEQTLDLAIRAITIQPETLDELRLGIPFSQTFTAICGAKDVALSLEGELPPGLSFDSESGLLSGMADPSGKHQNYSFTIHAAGGGLTAQRSYCMRVEDYIDLEIDAESGLIAELGTPIRIPLRASRGVHDAVYLFSGKGQVPPGIRIGGMRFTGFFIEGVPESSGTYDFFVHVEVEDSVPTIAVDVPFRIVVREASEEPLVLDGSLPMGKVAELFSAQLKVSGGKGRKVFSWIPEKSSSQLPSGFTLSEQGEIHCAPQATESGLYSVFVRVTDEAGGCAEAALPLYVGGLLTVTPAPGETISVPSGRPFALTIRAEGGFAGQFQYQSAGSLPQGFSITTNPDLTGTLSGILDSGSCRVAIEVDEAFAGSPVTTVVYYDLIAE